MVEPHKPPIVTWVAAFAVVTACFLIARSGNREFRPIVRTESSRRPNPHTAQSTAVAINAQISLPLPKFLPPLTPRVATEMGDDAIGILENPQLKALLERLDGVGPVAARPHGYRGDRRRVQRGLSRATAEGALRIVVVGGSMPAGAGLSDSDVESWPSRLERMLKLAWPGGNASVVNLAMGGVPSDPQVAILAMNHREEIQRAHLVIVDIAINDRLKHPWILSLSEPRESHRGSKKIRSGVHEGGNGDCMAVEGCELMDALLTLCHSETGIVYFETFGMSFRYDTIETPDDFSSALQNGFPRHPKDGTVVSGIVPGGWNRQFNLKPVPNPSGKNNSHALFWISDNFHPEKWPLGVASGWHWPQLLRRRIPVISYGDGASQAALHTHPRQSILWSKYPHPDNVTHMFCALVVLHGIVDMIWTDTPTDREALWDRVTSLQKPPRPSFMTMCQVKMVTLFGAMDAGTFKRAAMAGGDWRFYEDVTNKPGWIAKTKPATGNPEKRMLGFNVTLGPRRRIVITHLRTYGAGLGQALCSVGCKPGEPECSTTTVKTQWAQHASQAAVTALVVPKDLTARTNESTVWCLSLGNGKVKLMAVGSC